MVSLDFVYYWICDRFIITGLCSCTVTYQDIMFIISCFILFRLLFQPLLFFYNRVILRYPALSWSGLYRSWFRCYWITPIYSTLSISVQHISHYVTSGVNVTYLVNVFSLPFMDIILHNYANAVYTVKILQDRPTWYWELLNRVHISYAFHIAGLRNLFHQYHSWY